MVQSRITSMVSYAYDTIQRKNPASFFGMVYVLEGTSVALATQAANTLQSQLGLPSEAFTYLQSHGSIDEDHIVFLEKLLSRFEDPQDHADIVHSARRFFYLYAQIFRTLPDRHEAATRPDLRDVA